MADFLNVVSTRKTKAPAPPRQAIKSLNIQDLDHINSKESALQALKSNPDLSALESVLKYVILPESILVLPEPLNAGIVHQLVNHVLPTFWRSISNSVQAKLFAQALRNSIGLGHLLTRLRSLLTESQQKRKPGESHSMSEHIEDVLDVFNRILIDDQTSLLVLEDVLLHGRNAMQRQLIWREYLAQTVSGRILSLAAEAEDVLKAKESRAASWLVDGNSYACWLGRNIAALVRNDSKNAEYVVAVIDMCSKGLRFGYTDRIVHSLLSELISSESIQRFGGFMSGLKSLEQRKVLDAVMSFLIHRYFPLSVSEDRNMTASGSSNVSKAASLLNSIVENNDIAKEHLASSLVRASIPVLDDSLAARRSVIATLASDEEKMHKLLEKCVQLFSDSIYIKHTPILQQEALAQNLLLCCGYVHRVQPTFLLMTAKSTWHINGMSHRIGAISARARFLGIAVGVAISKMVDKSDIQLKFDLEEAEAAEAAWYQHLTQINDQVGDISQLNIQDEKNLSFRRVQSKPKVTSIPSRPLVSTEAPGPRIIEILSQSADDNDDDDLVPYEKPDSDPEDDGDDPETINRNKPTAPVYIRDLIAGLRDQDNYDRHVLALSTAASLIRRKADFGTEVIDHLEELATLLTGLQDNLELENFAQKRQQALVAILLVKPAQMAHWFARAYFSGDYSFTQRIAMLSTLGLGARELAGIKDSASEELALSSPSFPSKKLPPHLHEVYAGGSEMNPVGKVSSSMVRKMLSPIVSQAADQLSGPNIFKVRTFSSRMEVEKRRQKPIPNALAQVVANNFFFPLTGRWWLQVRASSDSIYTSTHLLPHFLQTLSILMDASGPNTLALPQMTREYWDLLLSARGLASQDKNILNGVLFGFLTLLETNENKERLVTEHGKELMETQAWVKTVFERLGTGSEEDEKVRALAAGVVVRCQEVVEKYQRRMVGALMDY